MRNPGSALEYTVADPGFPVGGRGPPTWVLFGKNVCENERIWSHRGGVGPARPLDPPMIRLQYISCK